ncbi:Cytochrome P450 CYP73A100 [Vitis vinifera]|uniref:Trans-cinnamate 4-monooxygenase n=1 Tax=Vitis vinifera TaxID=29760 RepID=A0A438HWA0_VITVI|nr:Cytochrome P450 CYP73A100 [Vitis vinifera]
MAHLLNKPFFFTLVTIILLSSTRLLASYLPISPNIARFLPLAPLILYLFYSISKRSASLPPGPLSIPIFGNWLQVGNDLNHQLLASMAQKYGPVFLLKLGSKNLTVVSDPELASRCCTHKDMVFTVYGDHWRKMRRIMTLPFFTNKVVHQYSEMWEEEMDLVVDDLRNKESVKTEGLVIRKRLQLMLYNIMYRMMFDAKFESQEDPLFIQATRELQSSRLAFFNNYYVEKRREIMAANGEKHKIRCAIDHIIDAQHKGEISEENVLYIVENINVAAIETTLWSMEWAIAELVNHPHVQSKIRDEITTVLQGGAVTESNLHQLPYLQATVKETLRLHSPIPLLVPHMNLEEAKLGGILPSLKSPRWWLMPGGWPTTPNGGRILRSSAQSASCKRSGVALGIILALPILALVIGKMVMNFEMRPPIGVERLTCPKKEASLACTSPTILPVAFTPITA